MSEEAWWVSNNSLNEAAHPGLHYSELSLQTPGPWGQECNPPTIPPSCPWDRRKIFLNEPLSSDDKDLYFLACAIHPQDTFPLLSLSLLIFTLHPLPLLPLLHSGVHTHLPHTYTCTYRAYISRPFTAPLDGHRNCMDAITQRRMKPGLCPWLCTRGNTRSSGEKGLVWINMYDVTWPSRLPWCYSRQPNTFSQSTWQRCQPPSGVTFSGLRATLYLSHPHSRLDLPSPSSHQKTCPIAHDSFSHDHLFWHTPSGLIWKQQNNLCLFPSNRGDEHLSYAAEVSGHHWMLEWQIFIYSYSVNEGCKPHWNW